MEERDWFCRECGKKNFQGWGDHCNACRAKERRHKEIVEGMMRTSASNEGLEKPKPLPMFGEKLTTEQKLEKALEEIRDLKAYIQRMQFP